MRYKIVLENKGIPVIELPKTLQKQIEKMNEILLTVDKLKAEKGEEDVEYKNAVLVLAEFDEHLSGKLEKFNIEGYRKRLANLRPKQFFKPASGEPRNGEPATGEAPKIEPPVVEPVKTEPAKVVEMTPPAPAEEEFAPVETEENVLETEAHEVVEEEFEKKGKGKMSTVGIATTMIVIGAVLVVAGSIMFWKNHRKQ